MVQFNDWCDLAHTVVDNRNLWILSCRPNDVDAGIQATARIAPTHYASEERIAEALARLGKIGAAQMAMDLLPESPRIRSGDLGEIFATEWINSSSPYQAPIKRLRWKDHRNMAMRGDDVIGMTLDPITNRLRFLKAEAKSRANLTANPLNTARGGLDKDGGLPSAHALSFISARLKELAIDVQLANSIDEALFRHGIPIASVTHLTFVFSGNPPQALLNTALAGYQGQIPQWGVGLHVANHTVFVAAIYQQVIANANNP